ncbi:MAG: preprotein translocase subunit SecE [Ruminococcus sp.]|nr:preprotein translocase subunit SecE [Ruminococcus sp.]
MAKQAEINSKASKSKKESAKSEKKKGGIKKFLKDLRSEIKKVVWPTKKQIINNTGIVLTVMVIMGLFLAGIDAGLGAAVKALLNLG